MFNLLTIYISGQFRRTNGLCVGGSRRSEVNAAIECVQIHLPTIEESNNSNKSDCSQHHVKSSIQTAIPIQHEESTSV